MASSLDSRLRSSKGLIEKMCRSSSSSSNVELKSLVKQRLEAMNDLILQLPNDSDKLVYWIKTLDSLETLFKSRFNNKNHSRRRSRSPCSSFSKFSSNYRSSSSTSFTRYNHHSRPSGSPSRSYNGHSSSNHSQSSSYQSYSPTRSSNRSQSPLSSRISKSFHTRIFYSSKSETNDSNKKFTIYCNFCKNDGHYERHCHLLANVLCFRCEGYGHQAKRCPTYWQ